MFASVKRGLLRWILRESPDWFFDRLSNKTVRWLQDCYYGT